MEKSITISRKVLAASSSREQGAERDNKDRKDHLKIWSEIYQDVRRQWAEAENYSPPGGRYGK